MTNRFGTILLLAAMLAVAALPGRGLAAMPPDLAAYSGVWRVKDADVLAAMVKKEKGGTVSEREMAMLRESLVRLDFDKGEMVGGGKAASSGLSPAAHLS